MKNDVILTPVGLLGNDEREERVHLTQLCSVETTLELIATSEKTLEIYHEERFGVVTFFI